MPKLRNDIINEIKQVPNSDLKNLFDLLKTVDIKKSMQQLLELQKKHLQLQQNEEIDDDADLVEIAYETEHDLFRYIEILNDVRDGVNKIASFMYDERGLLKEE